MLNFVNGNILHLMPLLNEYAFLMHNLSGLGEMLKYVKNACAVGWWVVAPLPFTLQKYNNFLT